MFRLRMELECRYNDCPRSSFLQPLQNGGTTAGSKDGTTAASAPSVLTDEDREFLVMLQGDVHRFNQYFMDKEEELVIRLQVPLLLVGAR